MEHKHRAQRKINGGSAVPFRACICAQVSPDPWNCLFCSILGHVSVIGRGSAGRGDPTSPPNPRADLQPVFSLLPMLRFGHGEKQAYCSGVKEVPKSG